MLNALLLLQADRSEVPLFSKQIGSATGETLVVVLIVALVVVLICRGITMWWFGVTTVVDRLDRIIARLETVEKTWKAQV